MFNSEIRETLDRQYKYAEKLRQRIEELEGLLASQHSQDFEALQDRCFDLDAKLAEYVKKKRELEATLKSADSFVEGWKAEAEQLRAENKRLREAIEFALADAAFLQLRKNAATSFLGVNFSFEAVKKLRKALEGGEDEK